MPNHIPQPPHSAGLAWKGLRPRLQPDQIPSAVDSIEHDRQKWQGKSFMTLPGEHPPLSTSDYPSIDQGNSAPKFVRVSTWNMPSTSSLARECDIPLAAVFQPFADLDPEEEAIPAVDTGEVGPARCQKCRAYINPWCRWTSGGNKWRCNLCTHESEVSPEYFSALDANLMRMDHQERPELSKGTVDFIVPEEYWASHPPPRLELPYHTFESPHLAPRKPMPMDYVFVFDVSREAILSGFTSAACEALRGILYGTVPCFPESGRIAVLTYDTSLHFYDLSKGKATLFVVSDIEEPFVPMREGLFVSPQDSRTSIETLLEDLSRWHADTAISETALGSVIRAAVASLAGRGGQVVIFQSVVPTIGPGALPPTLDESLVQDTDKEKSLFVPRDSIWKQIGEDCAEEGIGVSLFIGNNRFVDVGSIGVVASMTGGDIFFHPRFDPSYDAVVVASQLRRLVTRMTGYNCVLRVRASRGLRATTHYGSFFQRSKTDIEIGTLDADKAVSVSLEHSGSLDEREFCYLQCAVLYTTRSGQRRVRVLNLALTVVGLAGNVFKYSDMDTTVCHIARQAMVARTTTKLSHIREDLVEQCSTIFLGYRRNCAASVPPSQLIIPEAFRAFAVYILAIIKSRPLKGRNVSADVRNYAAHRISTMGVRSIMQYMYPRLLALHDLETDAAVPDPTTGFIEWPSIMRASHVYMAGHGLYLIDNEEAMIFWVGSSVSPQLLRDLFAVDDIMELNPHLTGLPMLDTLLSTQVRNIVARRQVERGGLSLKLIIARQNLDGSEVDFSDMLVEDQNNAHNSYIDFLCLVHKQIAHALKSGGSLTNSSTLRGTPW